jgi:hypothetical protein
LRPWRSEGSLALLKEFIAQGSIGDLLAVSLTCRGPAVSGSASEAALERHASQTLFAVDLVEFLTALRVESIHLMRAESARVGPAGILTLGLTDQVSGQIGWRMTPGSLPIDFAEQVDIYGTRGIFEARPASQGLCLSRHETTPAFVRQALLPPPPAGSLVRSLERLATHEVISESVETLQRDVAMWESLCALLGPESRHDEPVSIAAQ